MPFNWRDSKAIDADAVDLFFETLDQMDEVALLRMKAAWDGVDVAERDEAWTAVRAAGVLHGIAGEIEAVRLTAVEWATRGNNSIPYMMNRDEAWTEVKARAAAAIVDIALAAAIGDLLDAKSRDTLLAAWDGQEQV